MNGRGILLRKLTLPDFFEWVGERAARDGTTKADARSQRLHHRAVEAMGDAADAQILRVRGLHLVLLERLHLDDAILGWATNMAMLGVDIFGHFNTLDVVVGNKTCVGGMRKLTMWGMMIHYVTA
jgi:hypothetical protein